MKLVAISRQSYQNPGALIEAYGNWSDSWAEALRGAGYQSGFQHLEDGQRKPDQGCFGKFIERDEHLMIKVIRFKPETEISLPAQLPEIRR